MCTTYMQVIKILIVNKDHLYLVHEKMTLLIKQSSLIVKMLTGVISVVNKIADVRSLAAG